MIDPSAANAFLMQSGARSFKFENPGDSVRGQITDLTMQQQRDLKTQAPKFWDDGNPMMQLRITIQTELRDSDDPNDNGERSIYVRGEMQKAVREAIKAAGVSTIAEGGVLAVKFEALGQKTNPAFNAPKLYKAKYEAPAPVSVSTDDF